MHLLKIRVRIGARTNLANLVIFVGISFSFIALPSERFPIKRTTSSSDVSYKQKDEQKVVVCAGIPFGGRIFQPF